MKVTLRCPFAFEYKSVDKVESRVFYLEINENPNILSFAFEDCRVSVIPYEKRDPEEYLGLYHSVGEQWNWTGRKLLSKSELSQIINNEKVHIFLLKVDDDIAGYVEYDLRESDKDIEIVFFGIRPDYIGKGLGKDFLKWSIAFAWNTLRCSRLWLHTCDLDHPRALEVYKKASFNHYKTEKEFVDIIQATYSG